MKIVMKTVVFSLVVTVLSIGKVEAGPDSTATYLMNEPVSMLDWGCYRLAERLTDSLEAKSALIPNYENSELSLVNEVKKIILNAPIYVNYSYESNKIVIKKHDNDSFYPIRQNNQIMPIEERAKFWINEIKLNVHSPLYSFFSHNGFIGKEQPNDLQSALVNMVEIKVLKISKNGLETVCKSELNNKEIFCNDLEPSVKKQ